MLRTAMARTTRAAMRSASNAVNQKSMTESKPSNTRKSRISVKDENKENHPESNGSSVKQEEPATSTPQRSSNRSAKRSAPPSADRSSKKVKKEEPDEEEEEKKKSGLLSPSDSADYSESDIESSSLSCLEPATSSDDDASVSDTKTAKTKPKTKSGPKQKTAAKSKAKSRSQSDSKTKSPKSVTTPSKDLSDKKLQAYFKNANKSPFPTFAHPTTEEAKLAHRILSSLHGERTRPEKLVASTERAGCGDSPSVLDALVRTILSQNTSDKNSTRAKKNMDAVYGGSDHWEEIVAGGQAKLQESIKSGGLSVTKSKVIMSILEQAKQKYGEYSLDHLHEASSEDAMREMLSFQGVGPKTASCVLLFCLQRESFAVDTHVHRITGLLGWRPKTASRDETHAHLDVMIPDEDKYGLHILLVKHGKVCEECKAGGKNLGQCELRKAFRLGKVKGEAGDDVKTEEIERVKEEDGDESEWFGV